jgi:hypothetical protein
VGERERAWLNKKIFEMKKIAGGAVVVSFVVVGFQTAVDSPTSGLKSPGIGSWGQLVTTRRRQPSRNVRGVAKRLVSGQEGVSRGEQVGLVP